MIQKPVIPIKTNPYSSSVDTGLYYAVEVDRHGHCNPVFRTGHFGRSYLRTGSCPDDMNKIFFTSACRVCLDGQSNNFIALRQNEDGTYRVTKTHIDINTRNPVAPGQCVLLANISCEDDPGVHTTLDSAYGAVALKQVEWKIPFCPGFWMS